MTLNILNTDVACHSCIREYACKHKLKKGDGFEIDCNGIPSNYVSDEHAALLPSYKDVSLLLDPVRWAAEVLDWHCLDEDQSIWIRKNPEEQYRLNQQYEGRASKFHRPYQATMLRCSAKRKVFRIGRQAGKCLPSGTLIQMANGTQKPIEYVSDGDLVISMNEDYKSVITPAFRACNGEKPVAKLVLMDGREIEATYNHPFLTRTKIGRETSGARRAILEDEWKPLEELTTADYVAVPKNTHFHGEVSQVKKSSPKTEIYEDNDLIFIKIRSVEHVGTKMTWDLSVPETKNFIANNILTHNTETLVISMLFNLFTNNNFKIVLITPFQSQIDLIFKRLEELIRGKPALSNSIRRNVKAPQYSIELHNGSYVKGFTAGTKSGSGAASARGQPANMLVFDEADYLNPADMDAAMAIITNYPDATVWMSSTPSGKREKFYDACGDKEWKEYHYSSAINPNWNARLERFFRKNLTGIGYKHEVLADFGEQEQGVFQVSYVEAAQAEYKYEDMAPQPNWLYSVGVDWNSPAVGTTINVTGFNPATSKFYVVEREIVQRAGWTQLAACDAITKMNRKWQPFAIYVDRGYGATQIEILHKFGYDALSDPEKGPKHIDARLPHIVKAYDFGSKIETRDPFTKGIMNKPAKGFLVENTVRRFESNDIFFPKEDNKLSSELMGYVVKKVTVNGNFVYGTNSDSITDHNLDALMLALVAFTLEKTSFGKPKAGSKIAFTTLTNTGEESYPTMGKVDSMRDKAKAARPDIGRSDLSGNDPGFGHKDRESLPLWIEPDEKPVRSPYIPERTSVPANRRSVLLGNRRFRGGPPKRNNI